MDILNTRQLANRWCIKLQTLHNMRSLSNNYNYPHPPYLVRKGRVFYYLSDIIEFEKKKHDKQSDFSYKTK